MYVMKLSNISGKYPISPMITVHTPYLSRWPGLFWTLPLVQSRLDTCIRPCCSQQRCGWLDETLHLQFPRTRWLPDSNSRSSLVWGKLQRSTSAPNFHQRSLQHPQAQKSATVDLQKTVQATCMRGRKHLLVLDKYSAQQEWVKNLHKILISIVKLRADRAFVAMTRYCPAFLLVRIWGSSTSSSSWNQISSGLGKPTEHVRVWLECSSVVYVSGHVLSGPSERWDIK